MVEKDDATSSVNPRHSLQVSDGRQLNGAAGVGLLGGKLYTDYLRCEGHMEN